DRGDQDQLAVLVALDRLNEVGRDLRLVMAVRQKVFRRDAKLGTDIHDRLLLRGARDLNVGFEFGHKRSSLPWLRNGPRNAVRDRAHQSRIKLIRATSIVPCNAQKATRRQTL